ncbi:MAG: type II toxin-antitoxin system VapC family toxin [bacterium]
MGNKFYFDTSALLPYYRNESNSLNIQKFLIDINPPILISRLTRVEFASAIARWVRMTELSEADAGLIENMFAEDIKSGLLVVQSISPSHFNQAEKWISSKRTSLRTLDALHLACSWSFEAEMITCDQILHQAAKKLGIRSRRF